MRLFLIMIIVAALLMGIVYLAADYIYPYPEEVAEKYLENLLNENYNKMAELHHSNSKQPSSEDIAQAMNNFSEAYGLKNIEIKSLELQKEGSGGTALSQKATFELELKYSSEFFSPLNFVHSLELARDWQFSREGFSNWKIHWQDFFPWPEYGLTATFERNKIMPARGDIYDRQGNMLAGKGSIVHIGVQPGRITEPELLFETLEQELDLSRDFIKTTYQAPGIQEHWFVPLTSVSEERYQELDPLLRPIPGIFFQREDSRTYPAAEVTGHLTGYLGEITAEMIESYPERDYQPGEKVGRSGLELGLEKELRGKPGYQLFVRTDTSGGEKQELLKESVVAGKDFNLTLDLAMQTLAYETLGDKAGSLVVLDADSGDILTLASNPGFDPNEFIAGIDHRRWAELNNDPERPLFNRAAQGRYPPGSTFKAFTAATAIELGYFTPESNFVDQGEFIVEGNRIRNFAGDEFGQHTLKEAVSKSINTTMAQVGQEIGPNNMNEYFSKLKLDQRPDLSFSAHPGQLGALEQSQVNLAWSAIGQAEVLLTPLQMARLFAVFASGGYGAELNIVASEEAQEKTAVFQNSTINAMDKMLKEVITEGTGHRAALDLTSRVQNDIKLYGKTGTAEVGGQNPHAWFAGYLRGFQDRDLAFAIMLEQAGVGGEEAAPLVNKFFSDLLAEKINNNGD